MFMNGFSTRAMVFLTGQLPFLRHTQSPRYLPPLSHIHAQHFHFLYKVMCPFLDGPARGLPLRQGGVPTLLSSH